MNFFKSFLSSCLGAFVAFFIISLLLILFLTGIIGSISTKKNDVVSVKENAVLQLKFDAPIAEMESENPLEYLPILGFENTKPIGLIQLKQTIAQAAKDSNIKGIYLELSFFNVGYATAQEIRQSILDFRESGKWVIAYGEMMSEQAYLVASASDKVYIHPQGYLEFNGLTAQLVFFKKMFDKLEIQPEIFRVGNFKSAVEPFLLEKMSDASRLQTTEMVTAINKQLIADVAQGRNIDIEKVTEISTKTTATDVEKAVQLHLVDSLMYYDQVLKELSNRLGVKKEKDIHFVKYNQYKKIANSEQEEQSSKNQIAIIVAEGNIIDGEAKQGSVGSVTITNELRKARTNENVKAIVLRINSPGGSALASDVMWREIAEISKVKPIVASMGDYAASGGYYLAMACNTIVAQPNTITGSIGVFSVLFDMSKFFNNKIGITFDEVKTGEVGELVNFTRPLTPREKEIWQNNTNKIYATFTAKAAEGRKMPLEKLLEIASGRVWTGTQALQHGLVDKLGGIEEAIKEAASLAKLGNDYKLRYYPQYKSFFEEIITNLEENSKAKILKEELGPHVEMYKQIQELKQYQGIQARMPFQILIH